MKVKRVTPAPANAVDAIFIHQDCTENDYGDPELDETNQFLYPSEGHALLGNKEYCDQGFGITWSASGLTINLKMKDGAVKPVAGWVKFTWYQHDNYDARLAISRCIWEDVEGKPGIYIGRRIDLE